METPFYIGILVPFVVLTLLNFIQQITIVITMKQKLKNSQARLHFLQSCIVSSLFAVGWIFGLAMTGLSGIAADVLGALFIAIGGLLGLYVFLIYYVISPLVRKVWKEWFMNVSNTHYKKHESSQTPVKQLVAPTSRDIDEAQLHNENIELGSVTSSTDESSKHPDVSDSQTSDPVTPSEHSQSPEAPLTKKELEDEPVVCIDNANGSPDTDEETTL